MIGRVLRLCVARRLAEMMGELATKRALDDGVLETPDRRLELPRRDRSLADEVVENLRRKRR
jgi:hypothetical protein